MDHEVACRSHAVDRYLLAEMPEGEREEFEAHYFSCGACADEVRAGFALKENAKVVLREPAVRRREWWRFPVLAPSFAAMAFASVVAFQNAVTLPALRAPRALLPAVILDGSTRDSLPQIKQGVPLRFLMAVDGASPGDSLRVELVDDKGRVVRAGNVEAPAANRPLDVLFPGTLEAGRYAVVVRSSPAGTEFARNLFRTVKETAKK